jgi:FKBP-type peptidyl-prolyl cis-trans isomerase
MTRTWVGLMMVIAAVGLAACGGTVIDANSTPSPSQRAGASPGASGAAACSGADKSIPPGNPDSFAEGKDAQATRLPDGLQYVDITAGNGPAVKQGQCITMHYSLFLADGTPVESSRSAQGQGAFKFQAGGGQVIKGFDEGIQGLNVGGRRRITVPPELGYGAQGSPPKIPANSTLVFVIEVVGGA